MDSVVKKYTTPSSSDILSKTSTSDGGKKGEEEEEEGEGEGEGEGGGGGSVYLSVKNPNAYKHSPPNTHPSLKELVIM